MAKQTSYTMRDVARLAGVSISTVSAVVNNKGIVGPELTAVVQKAIAAMNFSPHAGARGLRTGRTHMLGLVVQDITNPFFVEALRGVEDQAIEHGYEVLVCNSNDRSDLELRHLESLHTKRVDGILLAPTDSYAVRETLARDRAPVVFIDCIPMKAKVNCVVTDNFDACYNGVRVPHRTWASTNRRDLRTIDPLDHHRSGGGLPQGDAGIESSHPRRTSASGRFSHREWISYWSQPAAILRSSDRNFYTEQSHGVGNSSGAHRIENSLPIACQRDEF